MDNATKLQNLLDAIDEVETFPDGSVRIKWCNNVYHEYPGHVLTVADGSVVLKGHQVHFNPELNASIKSIEFNDIQQSLDQAVAETAAKIQKEKTGCVL
jgi:hypothetical protein